MNNCHVKYMTYIGNYILPNAFYILYMALTNDKLYEEDVVFLGTSARVALSSTL
jgi:hypothetical protein